MKLFLRLTHSISRDIMKTHSNGCEREVKEVKIDKRKLEIAMARAKLNRDTMARKAGMPIPTVSNVFGRGSCKPATAGRIAEALGVDVTEILE